MILKFVFFNLIFFNLTCSEISKRQELIQKIDAIQHETIKTIKDFFYSKIFDENLLAALEKNFTKLFLIADSMKDKNNNIAYFIDEFVEFINEHFTKFVTDIPIKLDEKREWIKTATNLNSLEYFEQILNKQEVLANLSAEEIDSLIVYLADLEAKQKVLYP